MRGLGNKNRVFSCPLEHNKALKGSQGVTGGAPLRFSLGTKVKHF